MRVNPSDPNVIRLLARSGSPAPTVRDCRVPITPPLTLSREEADQTVELYERGLPKLVDCLPTDAPRTHLAKWAGAPIRVSSLTIRPSR
jgi:hypothetical protein